MSICIKCGKTAMLGVIVCNDCVFAMFGCGKEGNSSLPADTEVLGMFLPLNGYRR